MMITLVVPKIDESHLLRTFIMSSYLCRHFVVVGRSRPPHEDLDLLLSAFMEVLILQMPFYFYFLSFLVETGNIIMIQNHCHLLSDDHISHKVGAHFKVYRTIATALCYQHSLHQHFIII